MLMEEEVTQLTAGMAYSLQKHQQGKIPKKKYILIELLIPSFNTHMIDHYRLLYIHSSYHSPWHG